MDTLSIQRDYFGALAYDPEHFLFTLGGGYIGFGFLTAPIAGYNADLKAKMNVALNLPYPAGSVAQFSQWYSPDIEVLLERFTRMRASAGDALLREQTRERLAFLRGATRRPIDMVNGYLLRNAHVVMTTQLPCPNEPTEQDWLRAIELRRAQEATLRTIGFQPVPLTAALYIRVLASILNHGERASWRDSPRTRWDEDTYLCHQLLDPDTDIRVDRTGLWLGQQRRVRMLSPKHLPQQLEFGAATRFVADTLRGGQGIPQNCLITTNVVFEDHETRHAKIDANRTWTERQAGSRLASFRPEIRERKRDLDLMYKATQNGDRIVRAYTGVAVFAESEDASIDAANNARTYWRALGFQLMEDHFYSAPLFANVLPFGLDVQGVEATRRFKTMATQHVVPTLPVLGTWRGTGTPLLTLVARDGQVMSVSPWDAGIAPHGIIIAATGSGKSFLANDFITNARATGARVRVIDIGRSYKKLCDVSDGQFIEFGATGRISLNPFSKIVDIKEESDTLVSILTAMAAPSEPLTNVQIAELRRTLADVFAKKRNAMIIDDLMAALQQSTDQRVRDVGTQLYAFSSAGEYGRWFSGENTLRMDNPFVVLELEELRNKKHLQRVVLMQLLHQMAFELYLGDRKTPTVILIDECWSHLSGDGDTDVQRFIEGIWATVRKYAGAAWAVTQSMVTLTETKAGRTILANSPNRWLLKQLPESITLAEKSGALEIGEHGLELLRTLTTVKGEYSEILVSCEGALGVGRLFVSHFTQLLYSTDPPDVAAIEAKRQQGLGVIEAIHAVLAERGLPRARAA